MSYDIRGMAFHQKIERLEVELAQVKQERNAARAIAEMVPDMCDGDCTGDYEAGIGMCPAYQPPDVLNDGTRGSGGCMVQLWRGVCAEKGERNENRL